MSLKKLAFLYTFLFICIAANIGNVFAGSLGLGGGVKPAVWRSTRMAGAASMVGLSTGPMRNVHIHAIIVSSPTVNVESWLTLYNSTTASVGGYNPNVTTAAHQNTMSTQEKAIPSGQTTIWDVLYSSGVVFNKVGNAEVYVLWDFIDSRDVSYIPYLP